jgi:uncharacterized protein
MVDESTKVSRIGRAQWWRPRKVAVFFFHVLISYAVLVLLAYLFQDRLIYLPERTSMEEVARGAQAAGLKLWPENVGEYRGLVPINPPSAARGTVVVFHGNAGNALDRNYYMQPLQRLGFRVILAEYPGYGGRAGKPGETILVADGRETVRMALREFGGPIHVWGESLGCGVASAVVADPGAAVDGVILLTPWDSLPRTAQAHYWFLPARWLVRDKYDNVRNLQRFSGPVAVLVAGQDEVIPNRLTQTLLQNITATKRSWVFQGAGHNSWPIAPELTWWAEVMDFVGGRNHAEG